MYCILVGGLPAAGKSHMARWLSRRLGLPMFSKDEIKELLYDSVGFRCRAEKVALGVGALEAMYYAAGRVMDRGGSVILENNFEEASKPGLLALLQAHSCQPVTLLLTGEAEALYSRFLQRDLSPERHRGHVVNTCYPEPPGDCPKYSPISFEQYVAGFTQRGMASFDIGGPRILVDVTDFNQVDYEGVARQVLEILHEGQAG